MARKLYRPFDGIPASVVKSRTAVLADRVRGKTVLDLGCTGTKYGVHHPRYRYLHHELAESAREILGIDIDREAVDAMRAEGFNVVAGDAATMDLGRKFEVIVAGEIIEHLPNPGLFLDNLHRHLEAGGEVLISTPNPFRLREFWKILKHGQVGVHREHTLWLCPTVMKRLLEMCGFRIEHLYWIRGSHWYRPGRWPAFLRKYWNDSFMVAARPIPE